MENKKYYYNLHKNIINDSKLLIDRNIYKLLFKLFYHIFLKSDESFPEDKLQKINEIIRKLNINCIKKEKEKLAILTKEYSNNNFINIIKFVKHQNCLYAGEIIENILIIIFSFAFKTGKENSFGKYIYNNISKLKDKKNYDIVNWFIREKIFDKISNLKELLKNDIFERNFKTKIQEEPIFDLLFYI